MMSVHALIELVFERSLVRSDMSVPATQIKRELIAS